jgi:Na+/H+ antiporter NhaD/arsenite permease-like protein
MNIIILLIFILGYIAISFERKLKTDKAAIALVSGVLCWLIYFLTTSSAVNSQIILIHHLGDISSILFFLLGAMTIVEMVDSHQGFSLITDAIRTRSKSKLLIIIVVITFFLSSILDNLTTAIIMATLCKKLLHNRNDRLWYMSMVIIAANAGGAWSPMGDVTTTMLWIGNQITVVPLIVRTFLPCLGVLLLPLLVLSIKFRNQNIEMIVKDKNTNATESNIMLFTGLGLLLFVPVFKVFTHMPPFMGMLLALSIIWITSNLIHLDKHPTERYKYSVTQALRRIDTSSILFFLGLLLAVSALQSAGVFGQLAKITVNLIKNPYITGSILGLFSAIIDNVPLVAATQDMFSPGLYPDGHVFWEIISMSTGTGGSIFIIGSAAGIAVMGIEQIDFMWYLKKISWLAFLGFIGGLALFLLQQELTI